ncbi:MAG TPA: CcmD family protein [Polyangiaceae bacterium]|nr:CcmD family protein [Polyangiaceae bacterium]
MDDQTNSKPSAQVGVPGDRSTEFAPVTGGPELTSAGTLLVVAYLAMWAVLMVMIWLGWRRQQRIDQRLQELSRVLGTAPATDVSGPSGATVRAATAKL